VKRTVEPSLTLQSSVSTANQSGTVSAVTPVSRSGRERIENYLRESGEQVRLAAASIPKRSFAELAPLTFSLEQLVRRAQQNTDKPPFYNETITVHRKGALDIAVLERSVVEIIRRHEIWRTSFDSVNGRPVQIIHPAPTGFRLPLLDLSGLPESAQELEVLRSVVELARHPFDLWRGPLLRFLLIRLSDTSHRLVLAAHQSIVDGVSAYQVLPTELATLYQAFSEKTPSPLPEPTIQFADYAVWQRRHLDREETDAQIKYWRQRLAGELPVLRWPNRGACGETPSRRGIIRPFAFTNKVAEALKSTARQESVTLFMALLSGFVALLHGYTAQNDIVVGTLSPAGRKRTELQGLLGYFLNPVALRFDLSSNPTFRDLLHQAKQIVSEAISNDDVPLERLAEQIGCANDLGHPPFGVAISLQPPVPENVRPEWDVTSMDAGNGGAMWDLYLAFIDRSDGMIGRAHYNSDAFRDESITHMLGDLEALLERSTSGPGLRLSDLSGVIEEEAPIGNSGTAGHAA
jgi:Condensation domain